MVIWISVSAKIKRIIIFFSLQFYEHGKLTSFDNCAIVSDDPHIYTLSKVGLTYFSRLLLGITHYRSIQIFTEHGECFVSISNMRQGPVNIYNLLFDIQLLNV